jgi:hypothetical protein
MTLENEVYSGSGGLLISVVVLYLCVIWCNSFHTHEVIHAKYTSDNKFHVSYPGSSILHISVHFLNSYANTLFILFLPFSGCR